MIDWLTQRYLAIPTSSCIRTPNNLQPCQYHRLQPPSNTCITYKIQHVWNQTLWCKCYITVTERAYLTYLFSSIRVRLARSALQQSWKRKTSLMKLSLLSWQRRRILLQNSLRSSLSDKSQFSMTMAILFMVRLSSGMIPQARYNTYYS